ncbi:hypothetical protein [Actinomadura sp. K4S16]|uniref:hypothetical protein n=1 Tax=Actinomadura sp. K4S16 TaxID=1316147 RepID=UPI0011EFBEE4|nr:hypothetical protein [Actinomadura sp. K4S16]
MNILDIYDQITSATIGDIEVSRAAPTPGWVVARQHQSRHWAREFLANDGEHWMDVIEPDSPEAARVLWDAVELALAAAFDHAAAPTDRDGIDGPTDITDITDRLTSVRFGSIRVFRAVAEEGWIIARTPDDRPYARELLSAVDAETWISISDLADPANPAASMVLWPNPEAALFTACDHAGRR